MLRLSQILYPNKKDTKTTPKTNQRVHMAVSYFLSGRFVFSKAKECREPLSEIIFDQLRPVTSCGTRGFI